MLCYVMIWSPPHGLDLPRERNASGKSAPVWLVTSPFLCACDPSLPWIMDRRIIGPGLCSSWEYRLTSTMSYHISLTTTCHACNSSSATWYIFTPAPLFRRTMDMQAIPLHYHFALQCTKSCTNPQEGCECDHNYEIQARWPPMEGRC